MQEGRVQEGRTAWQQGSGTAPLSPPLPTTTDTSTHDWRHRYTSTTAPTANTGHHRSDASPDHRPSMIDTMMEMTGKGAYS